MKNKHMDDLSLSLLALGISNTHGEEKNITAKIIKQDDDKRLVYGVVLEPDTIDAQKDIISNDEIEKTAHTYLEQSRIVGKSHQAQMNAGVVESYIAPIDFELNKQSVKKGSWLLVVKVTDEQEWENVKNGTYTGFSVGGFGKRRPHQNIS